MICSIIPPPFSLRKYADDSSLLWINSHLILLVNPSKMGWKVVAPQCRQLSLVTSFNEDASLLFLGHVTVVDFWLALPKIYLWNLIQK